MWRAGVDLRRCQRCHRPSRFWGDRDKETGWVGWCCVCNWVWRFGDATRLMAFRLLKPLPRDAQGPVCAFLAGEACYAHMVTGSARSALRRVEQDANRTAWHRVLLGNRGPTVRDRDGTIRDCDSSDEDSDDVIDVNLDFVNPLWKLQLAWQECTHVSAYGIPSHSILRTVIDMLGKRPMA